MPRQPCHKFQDYCQGECLVERTQESIVLMLMVYYTENIKKKIRKG